MRAGPNNGLKWPTVRRPALDFLLGGSDLGNGGGISVRQPSRYEQYVVFDDFPVPTGAVFGNVMLVAGLHDGTPLLWSQAER